MKQASVAHHSTGSELRVLYSGVAKTVCMRSFLASIGYPLGAPVLTYEDNQAMITSVLADHLTLRLHHLDCLIRALHEFHLHGHYVLGYTKSKNMLADASTKPLEGSPFLCHIHCAHGICFYPPAGSDHYKLGNFHLFHGGDEMT